MICHTRCRARSFSGDAHCTNMTHSLLATNQTTVYYVPQTSGYIPPRNVCLAPTTTSRPPQSKAELGRVVLPSCRRAGPSSGRIVTLHVLEQVPLSTRSNVPRRPRPDLASVNAPIGFVGTVLLIPVVSFHNQFEKKILVVLLCEAANLITA